MPEPVRTIRRQLTLRSESFDAQARTVDIVYATSTPVRYGRMRETLRIDDESLVSDRMDAGHVYLIWNHNAYDTAPPVGRVIAHRVEDGEAVATIQLSEDPAHAGVIADIESGMLRSVSAGFRVYATEETENEDGSIDVTVTRWEPYEISLTVIPADPASRIRAMDLPAEERGILARLAAMLRRSDPEQVPSSDPQQVPQDDPSSVPQEVPPPDPEPDPQPEPETEMSDDSDATPTTEEDTMTPEEILAAERARVAAITALQTRHDLPADFVTRHVEAGTTEDAARADALELIAARSAPDANTARTRVTRDEHETFVTRAEAALVSRMTGEEPTAEARELRNLSTVELARRFVGAGADSMSRSDVIAAALSTRSGMHTTSDFAAVLGNAGRRTLRAAYDAAPRSFGAFTQTVDLSDFRPHERVSLGDAPNLKLRAAEGVEVTYGTVGESSESIQLATYDRALSVSRQMLVNDDLGSFARIASMFGRRAAELEADLVYAVLTGSQKMSDGKNLFHASRGNMISAGLDVAGLSAARAAMRKQRGIDGGHIAVAPRTLIVGPDMETEAQKILSPISATVAGNVNVFSGSLGLAVDSRIEGNDFYVAADPAALDTIELGYLDGARGVQVRTIENPMRDGVDILARLDVAARAIEWRGLLKATAPAQQ
jgi:HK97 family phage prohead protease